MNPNPSQSFDPARTKSISKLLSYVLRHAPQSIGIELDATGWTSVDDLLQRSAKAGKGFSREELHFVVQTNDKKRFTFSDDGSRIRAAQGHSVDVDLELAEVTPPAILYHGTARRFLESIWAKGLLPGSRQKVHLSSAEETALAVGKRHGEPVVLQVAAGAMHTEGLAFWQAENGVWLTDTVPPRFLSLN